MADHAERQRLIVYQVVGEGLLDLGDPRLGVTAPGKTVRDPDVQPLPTVPQSVRCLLGALQLLPLAVRRRKLHEAGTGNHTGRADSNCQRLYSQREKLRINGPEIPGELSTGTELDPSV